MFVRDVPVISPGCDPQHGNSGQHRRLVDGTLRCRNAPRKDAGVAAQGRVTLTVESQLTSSQLAAPRLAETLSELARKYRVPGAQLAVHHGGTTVAVEVGELTHG